MTGRSRVLRDGPPATAGVAVAADRRFRRPDVRPGRRRPAARVVRRIVRIGGPLALAAVAATWLGGAVLESQLLRIDTIVVRGTTRLAVAEVEALVDGLRGTNILSADLEVYRARVLASSWVADATLSRVLPSTVEIRIVERLPIAAARVGSGLQLVDAAGVLIEPYGPAHADLSLPIVDGLVHAGGDRGPVVDTGRMEAATDFLGAIARAPALYARVSQVDVSRPADVVVLLDGDPAWLHLGREAFVERLERYLAWAPALRPDGAELDYADLRLGGRVVVRPAGRRTERSPE